MDILLYSVGRLQHSIQLPELVRHIRLGCVLLVSSFRNVNRTLLDDVAQPIDTDHNHQLWTLSAVK